MKIADANPNFPISSAIFSNFNYNGVGTSSSWPSNSWILPIADNLPTAIITIFPSPDKTLLPESIIGDGTSWAPASSLLPSAII